MQMNKQLELPDRLVVHFKRVSIMLNDSTKCLVTYILAYAITQPK